VFDSGAVPGVQGRQLAILGVLWPSKKFTDRELIASGAASGGSPVTDEFLKEQLEDLKGIFDQPDADAKLEEAKQLVPRLEDSPAAQREFVNLIRSVLPAEAADEEDASTRFFSLSEDQVMDRLSRPVLPTIPAEPAGVGGAGRVGDPIAPPTGGAAGLGEFFSGIRSGARNLLNYSTYYQMKERAGTVGREGINSVLREIRVQRPVLNIHLIGHSFGGRLVTAAALGPANQPSIAPNTMTLLQAAFSHHGFAHRFDEINDGFFRKLVTDRMVSGPILITCTENDTDVGIAYPLASLIAGQVAAGIGDKNDPFGGIGRNGAQKTPEAFDETLLEVGKSYQLVAEKLHNLKADQFIKHHSDICKNEVAYAILSAVATT
jgi:hypothetical protein